MTRPILAAEFAAHDGQIDHCWKQIGIHGDRSCPELARHKHCHGCPTFSLAAAALFDRELPADAATGPIGRFGGVLDEAHTESVVIFRIGKEWFALPTLVVDEVVAMRPTHSLPHCRNAALCGLVNVRGELVICISLAMLLDEPVSGAAPGRLIITRHPGGRIAFPVDEVQGTRHHSPADLEEVPATLARSASGLTKGLLRFPDRQAGRIDEHLLFDTFSRSLT